MSGISRSCVWTFNFFYYELLWNYLKDCVCLNLEGQKGTPVFRLEETATLEYLMSFILSDTGKKVAVVLKYYPWLLFCLSCSDFSILAVTAFPKSLCFVSKHRQLLHKICIALVAVFWLFNRSSLKLVAQNFSETVWENSVFSMQCKMEKKQEGSVRYLFFFFPSLFFAKWRCFDYRHPSLVFSSELLFYWICLDAGLGPPCHLHHLECGWGRVICGRWHEIGYCWGQWANASVWCELESAGCFKLDSPVVPDLCVRAHHSMFCVSCPSHALQNASKCQLLLLSQGAWAQLWQSPLSCLAMQVSCCFACSILRRCPGHLYFPQFSHLGFLGCISQSHVAVPRLYRKCVSLVLLSQNKI